MKFVTGKISILLCCALGCATLQAGEEKSEAAKARAEALSKAGTS
jgi:hypothetical protein